MKYNGIGNRKIEPWRFTLVYLAIAVVFLFYLFQLFRLQILEGDTYTAAALENRRSTVKVPTTRGVIYDRNGFVLARNIPSYNVVITPANLPGDEGAIQQIYRQLSETIGVPVSQGNTDEETVRLFSPCQNDLGITQVVYIGDTNAPFSPIQIKCNVDETTARIVMEHASDWPGVSVEVEAVRDYPTGDLTAEIVGFLGPIPAVDEAYYTEKFWFEPRRDKVGYAGIESWMQEVLSGKNGLRSVEKDGAGQTLRDLEQPITPVPGNNVMLTIDTRLQSISRTALISEMDAYNMRAGQTLTSNGVVIAMDPRTGEILSLVSYPNFENNRMARFIPSYYYQQLSVDPNKPLLNHAISAEHPPGSVYKMAAAIGALNEGVVTPDQVLDDPGVITILQRFYENDPGKPIEYVCWPYKTTGKGHDSVNFLKGVAQSCDVYFYKIGGGFENQVPNGGLGVWRLAQYAKALGYGVETGIELPGEVDGLVPDPTWKRVTQAEAWATGDTYIATIGQGYVLSTPIQVLQSFQTLVNDGVAMKPTLIREVLSPEGEVIQPFRPVERWDITKDPVITVYDGNQATDQRKTVAPWVVQLAKEGMRLVVTDGTATEEFQGDEAIASAGKTGTAEYCDDIARAQERCERGNWPAHAWYVGYAPYDNPEIVVLAFVYNGTEGSKVAAPIVRKVMDGYFELKAIDNAAEGTP